MVKGVRILCLATLLGLLGSLSGCGGGGGGGGGFIGAAEISLDVTPTTIDTADRMSVRVNLSNVHENGIALKFKFPKGLEYVANSARLLVDGDEIDVGPAANVTVDSKTVYLVFYFKQSSFSEGDFGGELTLELKGTTSISDGTIGVDADVDDPLIDNSTEFDSSQPEFAAEDEVSISVEG